MKLIILKQQPNPPYSVQKEVLIDAQTYCKLQYIKFTIFYKQDSIPTFTATTICQRKCLLKRILVS